MVRLIWEVSVDFSIAKFGKISNVMECNVNLQERNMIFQISQTILTMESFAHKVPHGQLCGIWETTLCLEKDCQDLPFFLLVLVPHRFTFRSGDDYTVVLLDRYT